jgi:hypothetical protein
MDRAFSTHRGEEKCIKGFGGKTRRKETTITMYRREVGWSGVDWNDLVQHWYQRRARVNRVMKIWVP